MEPRHDLSTEDASLLYELQRLWHDRYRVDVNEDGVWLAERLTGAVRLTADTGGKLRPLIAQDAIQWNREVFARNNT